MKCDRKFRVEMTKNRRGCEQGLEFIEGGLGFSGPQEALAFAQQAGDWNDDTGISFDKATVEVGESKKHLDIKNRLGNRPFGDGTNAFGIHGDAFGRDDEAQEADLLRVEFAFLEFCV